MSEQETANLEHLLHRTQQALAEAQLLYETSQRISTALDVDDVIIAYMEQVAVPGRYVCTVVLYEFDETERRPGVVVRGRWSPPEGLQIAREWYPYTYDALDAPLDAGETVTIGSWHYPHPARWAGSGPGEAHCPTCARRYLKYSPLSSTICLSNV